MEEKLPSVLLNKHEQAFKGSHVLQGTVLLYHLLLFAKYLFHITLVDRFSFYFHRELKEAFQTF